MLISIPRFAAQWVWVTVGSTASIDSRVADASGPTIAGLPQPGTLSDRIHEAIEAIERSQSWLGQGDEIRPSTLANCWAGPDPLATSRPDR
ncbi:hypothetical protein ACN4EG_12425 [Alkalinema pantanalense CENA528]|uniref:hypothetical protein n=1 Tax=Alkalinema pantanalense TaxID=1620705 RepID=UPI003D6EA31D